MTLDPALADADFCYLTTTGRFTGQPRAIEIWLAAHGDTLYLLAGGRLDAHWVQNIQRNPAVTVRIGATEFEGRAYLVAPGAESARAQNPEDALARRLVVEKYRLRYSGDLEEWRRTALPVAIDLAPACPEPVEGSPA